MSSAPKPTMDPWLKAYAEKRRQAAGEPCELSPAARQELQRAVADQFPHSTAPPSWVLAWLFSKRASWIFGSAALLLLGLGTFFALRNSDQQDLYLAKNQEIAADFETESAIMEEMRERIAPTERALAPRQGLGLAGPGGAEARTSPDLMLAYGPMVESLGRSEGGTEAALDETNFRAPSVFFESQIAVSQPQAKPSLYFRANRAALEPGTASPPPILQSFELRRDNDQVVIVDSDGSIYEGALELEGENPSGPAKFQAAGVNRTLARPVIFTGRLEPQLAGGTRSGITRSGGGFGGGGVGGGASRPASRASQQRFNEEAASNATVPEARSQPQQESRSAPTNPAAGLAPSPSIPATQPMQWRVHGRASFGVTEEISIDAVQEKPAAR